MKKFNNFVNRMYLSLQSRKQALLKDERGVSAIVATVLLVLIVVLMVAVFYDKLAAWFKDMMDKIFGEESQLDKSKLG